MDYTSNSRKIPFGAARLCQDMEALVNNPQGSDVQFKVGGGNLQNGEIIYNESATVTFHAHSIILRYRSRYFATMLDEKKNWKESSSGVIYKPNISPSTLQDILRYIYTGDVYAKSPENIIELITAAEEMDLEELSTECQAQLMRTIEYTFSGEGSNEDEGISKESTNRYIPINVAIHTHIIPALNLATSHSLSHLSQELLTVILPNMSVITKSPDTYTTFINGVSSETLAKIIASDDLAMKERNVWDLVLSWGCHQARLSKAAVEARLSVSVPEDDEMEMDDYESSDEAGISDLQLYQLKEILTPLMSAIRFGLFDPDDYYHILSVLGYFISRHRFLELHGFFMNSDLMGQLDVPRRVEQIVSSIVVESTTWKFLRENIFKTGGITGCSSLNHLKFELLFRASEHNFLAKKFHQCCDNKGPTLVLVRSADGHLFGGVNFKHWRSSNGFDYSSSPLNFLFALPDGGHRKDWAIFRIENFQYSSGNYKDWGPTFGCATSDLFISDSANTKFSYSNLPNSYNGSGASKTALAGAFEFMVSDYEVFAIHKY